MRAIEDLVQEVRAVASELPDHIGKDPVVCLYVRQGRPSCLIGHALFRMGLIEAGFEYTDLNSEGIETLAEKWFELDSDQDYATLRWLSEVQVQQDNGLRWADAVREADEQPL